MADLVYVLLTAGFFALAVGLVHACDRIIGPDPEVVEDAAPAAPAGSERGPVVVEAGA